MQFQQNMNATIQDLKTQIGQLANIMIGRIQQPYLTNNFESERERKCSYVEKWKRIISTNTATVKINRSRLRTECLLTGATIRKKLSHCRFQLGPSRQGNQSLTKNR
ncbi:hypothetical protein CR513_06965, partial [Mucuna pruriens]